MLDQTILQLDTFWSETTSTDAKAHALKSVPKDQCTAIKCPKDTTYEYEKHR